MRDLFDDLMDRVERRDPWADVRREPVEDENPVEDNAEFPVDFDDTEFSDE